MGRARKTQHTQPLHVENSLAAEDVLHQRPAARQRGNLSHVHCQTLPCLPTGHKGCKVQFSRCFMGIIMLRSCWCRCFFPEVHSPNRPVGAPAMLEPLTTRFWIIAGGLLSGWGPKASPRSTNCRVCFGLLAGYDEVAPVSPVNHLNQPRVASRQSSASMQARKPIYARAGFRQGQGSLCLVGPQVARGSGEGNAMPSPGQAGVARQAGHDTLCKEDEVYLILRRLHTWQQAACTALAFVSCD